MLLLARLLLVFAVVFLLPLASHAIWWSIWGQGAPDWHRADWSSARLLGPAAETPEAVVRIYAARTGRWRGIFAHHSWIVVKEAGATRYSRFDKVGWGSPVRVDGWVADGRWYGNLPEVVVALDGDAAAALIPRIRAAIASYPYPSWGNYRAWPGPNSNTFVAHVLQEVPDLQAALPPTAIGKDWPNAGAYVGLTPSRTGLRVSLAGLFGVAVGWIEGIEVNILGLVAGLDIHRPAIKLPGWGRIGMSAAV